MFFIFIFNRERSLVFAFYVFLRNIYLLCIFFKILLNATSCRKKFHLFQIFSFIIYYIVYYIYLYIYILVCLCKKKYIRTHIHIYPCKYTHICINCVLMVDQELFSKLSSLCSRTLLVLISVILLHSMASTNFDD